MLVCACFVRVPVRPVCGDGATTGYIYDGAAKGDSRAVVINTETARVGVQSKSDADIGRAPSGFGGDFHDCGDQSYHCIEGPLHFAVPRKLSHAGQAFDGMMCESPKSSADRMNEICAYVQQQRALEASGFQAVIKAEPQRMGTIRPRGRQPTRSSSGVLER